MMKNGKIPTIFGDGEQSRDFSYVENVVNANLLACQADIEKCSGEMFNVACGKKITLNQLITFINENLETNIEPEYSTKRVGDVKHSQASIEKIERRICYKVAREFSEGLRILVNKYTFKAQKIIFAKV